MKECQSQSHTGWDCKYHIVFCTEAAEEARLWSTAQTFGRDVSRIGLVQVSEDRRRAPVGDHVPICISIPPKYAVPNVAGNLRRESAMQTVRKFGARRKEFHGRAPLGERVPRLDGCTGREHGSSVHPESGGRRRAVPSDEARNGVSRPRRLTVSWAPSRHSRSQATGFAGGI